MTGYKATPCSCGNKVCKDWHVEPVAAIQGVHFTKEQAEAVAALLNGMEKYAEDNNEDVRLRRRERSEFDESRCFKCGETVLDGICVRCGIVQNPEAEQCWACHRRHPRDADCTVETINDDA